jgi:hypothetical protein
MAVNSAQQTLQRAGDINIDEVTLISSAGQELDVKLYIGELNIFEDMFRTGLYGNVLMIDAANLISHLPLIGDEFIRIKIYTPSMENNMIYKTFKVYSITDRLMLSDAGKQSYILHFCSPEIFIDIQSPIFSTYKGKISEVVKKIFIDNISISRNGDSATTPLLIFPDTDNEIEFTSPGWRPMQALNWIASRAKAQGYKSNSYLLFESNRAYYFASAEAMIDSAIKSKSVYQEYKYKPNNVNRDNDFRFVRKLDEDYKQVSEMAVIENFNQLKNAQNGYLANRLITLDVITKKYAVTDYYHSDSYKDYKHLEELSGNQVLAPFTSRGNPATRISFYPQHKTLYTGFEKNVGDVIDEILPRRISTLNELTNFKLEIVVPGRTDIEVGAVIKFIYPDASPKDETDITETKYKDTYSGFYLVTAIRHKINIQKHMMILEIVKDSLSQDKGSGNSVPGLAAITNPFNQGPAF